MNWYKKSQIDDFKTITISIPKFEADWSKNPFYIGPQDKLTNPAKYQHYKELLQNNPNSSIEPATANIDETTGEVGLTDGRHRYSVLRDMGAQSIRLKVPKNQVQQFLALYNV